MELTLLQHYWWLLIALLGGLLVFLLFVQGGQSLLYRIGRTEAERTMIVNALGRKWEFTFTTLVTFGGAAFAAFPLFYSTSFGGAYFVWTAILLVFVIQTVGYEFRAKAGNILGQKTYLAFLLINGILAPLLLGVAVGTFFTGGNFVVETANIGNIDASTATISQWTSPWHGLEALWEGTFNLFLGGAVLFLAQALGLLYFIQTIDDEVIETRSRRYLMRIAPIFLVFFLGSLYLLVQADGWAVTAGGKIVVEPHKYLHNLLEMPVVAVLFGAGVVSVLVGLVMGCWSRSRSGIWFAGAGTVLTVATLLLLAGWNHTAYYPSRMDTQSSLTIFNSSSSQFTLTVMSWVSLLIPFVVAYIWWAWRAMNRQRITRNEVETDTEELY